MNESLCVCEGKKKKLGQRRKRKYRPASMAEIHSFFFLINNLSPRQIKKHCFALQWEEQVFNTPGQGECQTRLRNGLDFQNV